MKGEQPKPDIKPFGKKPNVDISSEEEKNPKTPQKIRNRKRTR